MNIKKLLVFCIMAAIGLSCTVSAAEINVDIDVNTTAVSVSGALGKDMAQKRLILYCMQSGAALSDITEETETPIVTDAFSGIEYVQADADGNYRFSDFMVNGVSGNYKFYISAEGSSGTYASESVYITSKSDLEGFIADIIAANSKTNDEERTEAVVSVLDSETETGLIGIKIPMYELLDAEARQKAAEKLKDKTFSNLTEIQNIVNIACVEPALEASESGECLDMILFPSDYEELSGIADKIKAENTLSSFESNPAFAVLNSCNKEERIAMLNKAVAIPNTNSIENKIIISVINTQLAECAGYGDVTAIIEANKNDGLIALDFDVYNTSKYRNELNKTLLNKSFNSCDELIKYIEKYLDDAKKAESNQTPSLGGGGGGGGGSSYYNPTASLPIAPAVHSFSDMSNYAWAKNAVESLYGKGIISGRTADIFAPADKVTREEFVKMIVAAFYLHDPLAVCDFSDVEKGAWYESYVASGVNNAIVFGVTEDKFGIGNYITRQDMAVITARAMGGVPTDSTSEFTDSDKIAEYAKPAVLYMKEKGIVSGYADGSFGPDKLCTRAEAATIIYAAISNR